MTASVLCMSSATRPAAIPALVDLPLQQAESEAQRRQGLTRLVVKLSGNVAPLAFLRLDEAV